tara:strand:+ start:1704 stop:1841 length:138 start_codon:yes stop_codon:yes gene_type:complete
MSKNALEGNEDSIGKTMNAVKRLIIAFEIVGLIILGSLLYNIVYY